MKYKNTKNKLRIIFNQTEDNKNTIDKLKKQEIKTVYSNFAKKIQTYDSNWQYISSTEYTDISLGYISGIKKYYQILGRTSFEVELINYREELLKYIHIVPILKAFPEYESLLYVQNASRISNFYFNKNIEWKADKTIALSTGGTLEVSDYTITCNLDIYFVSFIPYYAKILISLHNGEFFNEISST